ncbi:MAG: hypothetical protein HC811_03595 [Flammeovirgaceae bacterium]|nr:hypothetical protein [Flammeovirgaceae bacterium]
MKRLIFLILIVSGCSPSDQTDDDSTQKDLNEIMLELRVLHTNAGDAIKKSDFENASWLVEELDNTLNKAIKKFDSHRKLSGPFESFYTELLQEPIKKVRLSIEEQNAEEAIVNFRDLTSGCNACHKKHDIKKRAKFD